MKKWFEELNHIILNLNSGAIMKISVIGWTVGGSVLFIPFFIPIFIFGNIEGGRLAAIGGALLIPFIVFLQSWMVGLLLSLGIGIYKASFERAELINFLVVKKI